MNARVITALIVTGVLGWTMPAIAQVGFPGSVITAPLATSSTKPDERDFLGNTVTTRPTTALKKFLWSGVLFFHPNDSYTPIPLYGYAQASLWDDVYMRALREVARGNVHVAVAEWAAEDVYSLHGVFVDESTIGSVADYLKGLDEHDLITFTRPLKLDVDTPEIAAEFIASPSLWARPAVE